MPLCTILSLARTHDTCHLHEIFLTAHNPSSRPTTKKLLLSCSTFPHNRLRNTRTLHPYKADFAWDISTIYNIMRKHKFALCPHGTEAPNNILPYPTHKQRHSQMGNTSPRIFIYRMRFRLSTSHNPPLRAMLHHAFTRVYYIYR